jgi:hypothetical protein
MPTSTRSDFHSHGVISTEANGALASGVCQNWRGTAMTFADILNKLADLDDEIIRLEAERAVAQHAGDATQMARLDEEIGRLSSAKESLRSDFMRKHARSPNGARRGQKR